MFDRIAQEFDNSIDELTRLPRLSGYTLLYFENYISPSFTFSLT